MTMENADNNNEISELQASSEKRNTYLEYALFIILGFLLGIVFKTEAAKRITVGFNDYQINSGASYYNLNDLQKKLGEEQSKDAQTQEGEVQGGEEVSGESTSR